MKQGRGQSLSAWFIGAAVMYLLLPNVLFLLGWVQWYIALPVALCLLLSFAGLCRQISGLELCLQKSDAWVLPLLILGAAFCTAALGLHGHVPQQWDFTVRNPIYETLVRCDWPLYNAEGGYFVYYMAYWLPPALISKMSLGWISPTTILWWWNFMGVLLLLLIVWLRWRKRALLIMTLMLTMGSLNDMRRLYGAAKWLWEQCPALEWIDPYVYVLADWTNYFFLGLWNQIACNTPHSAIPICMTIALVLCKRLPWRHFPFVSSLTVLWSPLAAGVMLPWVALKMLGQLRTRVAWMESLRTLSLWSGVALVVLVGAYFTCAESSMLHWVGAETAYYNDWMLNQSTRVAKACAIMAMMCIPMLIFLWQPYRKTGIPLVCCILILLLPLVWVGYENNELLFKGSAVIFMLLVVLYASRFVHARRWWRAALVVFFILSAGEFCWDLGFRVLHKYTWDETAMQKNIIDDWQGHLNHPHELAYKNFFGRSPQAVMFYAESGASAQGVLRPLATGQKAADSNPERLK